MKTPDKIYLHGYEFSERPVNSWSEKQTDGFKGHKTINVEYIRKDALLDWVTEKMNYSLEEANNSGDKFDYAAAAGFGAVVDKIKSL